MNDANTLFTSPSGLFLLKNTFAQESNWRMDQSYKFIYALNGRMTYQSRSKSMQLKEGQFVLLNPYDEHKQLQVDQTKFLIELDATLLNETAKAIRPLAFDVQFASTIQQHSLLSQWVRLIVGYLHLEDRSSNTSLQLFFEHSFTQLSLLLAKNAVGSQLDDLPIRQYKSLHIQLYNLLDALKQSYNKTWSLADMSEVAQMEKFQLAHSFKEHIGVAPYTWLQLYRIIRSQEQLLYTRKSILSIALDCGFSSTSVYNRLFKNQYGLTPSQFRLLAQK
ncbi:helix-turn-helix transcriptional regulator [Shouchella patagoniensis]|uniref:helix-turn-helix transcriptional regulator n=1 Tax=Shouchella patagoniensis TaxID=228576 RepID=UPI001FE53254|nr:AraC family transcriptional regulator [Shouchella patagoniensis]